MTEPTEYEARKTLLIENYVKYKDISIAAKMTGGMNMLSAFKILKISGVMFANDRLKFGTEGSKLGAQAEIEFKTLVPKAVPMNADNHIHKGYDFTVGGVTVDVKCASLHIRKERHVSGAENKSWQVKIGNKHKNPNIAPADFYVLFFIKDGKKFSKDYHLFCLPFELMQGVFTVSTRPDQLSTHWINDFKVEPGELAGFFDGLVDDDGVVESAWSPKAIVYKDVRAKFTGKKKYLRAEIKQVKRINSQNESE